MMIFVGLVAEQLPSVALVLLFVWWLLKKGESKKVKLGWYSIPFIIIISIISACLRLASIGFVGGEQVVNPSGNFLLLINVLFPAILSFIFCIIYIRRVNKKRDF